MILKAPEHYDYEVCDADGVELTYCVWADTETGEAVHGYFDDDGRLIPTVGDHGEPCVRTEWRQHPAPLRYARKPWAKGEME